MQAMSSIDAGLPNARLLENERLLNEFSSSTNPFVNDGKLSDETYLFLQKKLSDANEALAYYTEREVNLTNNLDRLFHQNEEFKSQNSIVQMEIQTLRARQVDTDQKLDGEVRTKYSMQEKLSFVEKELHEERERFNICNEKLKEAESRMVGTDSLAKKMFSLASDSCAQTDVLRQEVDSLENLIDTCKSAMTKLSDEKQDLSTKLHFVETEYESYNGTMQDALADIGLLKEESHKQETYINDTLNRFKEISVHFDSMKQYVTFQQTKLQHYQQEISSRSVVETSLKNDVQEKSNEIGKMVEKANLKEAEFNQKTKKLEETLDSIVTNRRELEETNKKLEKNLKESNEESIQLKSTVQATQMKLESESEKHLDVKKQLEDEKKRREECQNQRKKAMENIHSLDLKILELSGEKSKVDETNTALEAERVRQKENTRLMGIELKSLSEEKLVLKENLLRTEAQLRSLQANLKELEFSNKDRNEQYGCLQRNYTNVSKEKDNLELELEEKSIKLETITRACSEQEKKIASLEEKLNQCQIIFMENEDKYQAAASQVALLGKENNEKQKLNDKAAYAMQEIQGGYDESLREKHDLQERLRDLKEEFEKYKLQTQNEKSRLQDEAKRIRLAVETDAEDREKRDKAQEEAIFVLNNKLKQLADIVDIDRDQIVKLQDRISFMSSRNEELLNQVSKLTAQKQEKENAISNIELTKSQISEALSNCQEELRDAKLELKERNQEFERFKEEVSTFEKLWAKQQTQALKELQAELTAPNNYCSVTDNEGGSLWDER